MERLFEAKATYNQQFEIYNVFRLDHDKYKAEFVERTDDKPSAAPKELTLFKEDGKWKTTDDLNAPFTETLGMEIEIFNNGYGDILGRIGID